MKNNYLFAKPSQAIPTLLQTIDSFLGTTIALQRIFQICLMLLFSYILSPTVVCSQNYELAAKKYDAARKLYGQKAYQQALQEVDSSIILGKASTGNLNLRAKICLKLDNTTVALSSVQSSIKAAKLWHEKRDAHETAALVFAKLGDTLKVLNHLNLSIENGSELSHFSNEPLLEGYWSSPYFVELDQERREGLLNEVYELLSYACFNGKLLMANCQNSMVDLNPELYVPISQNIIKHKGIKQMTITKNNNSSMRYSFTNEGRLLSMWSFYPQSRLFDSLVWDSTGKLLEKVFYEWMDDVEVVHYIIQYEYGMDGGLSKLIFVSRNGLGKKRNWGFKFEKSSLDSNLIHFEFTSSNEPYKAEGFYEYDSTCRLSRMWFKCQQDMLELEWKYEPDGLSYTRFNRFNGKEKEDEKMTFDNRRRLVFSHSQQSGETLKYNKKGQLSERETLGTPSKFYVSNTLSKMRYNNKGLLRRLVVKQLPHSDWKHIEVYRYQYYNHASDVHK